MKSVYRVLAMLIAAGVAFQAAVIAYALFALGAWVQGGGVLDKAAMEGGGGVDGEAGLMLHGIVGEMVVPALVILLLISSFFAKIPGGVKWALIIFGLTVLQIALAFAGFILGAGLGVLHGLNAFVLFGCAVMAVMRVRRATAAPAEATAPVPVGSTTA